MNGTGAGAETGQSMIGWRLAGCMHAATASGQDQEISPYEKKEGSKGLLGTKGQTMKRPLGLNMRESSLWCLSARGRPVI